MSVISPFKLRDTNAGNAESAKLILKYMMNLIRMHCTTHRYHGRSCAKIAKVGAPALADGV
jgi:hypothetical protein